MDVEELEQKELIVKINERIAKKVYDSYENQGFDSPNAFVNWIVAQAFLVRQ